MEKEMKELYQKKGWNFNCVNRNIKIKNSSVSKSYDICRSRTAENLLNSFFLLYVYVFVDFFSKNIK